VRDYETALPLRVLHQPEPFIQDGGDCGACVLAGLLGKSVPEVYASFMEGKPGSFHWATMRDALQTAEGWGLLERVLAEVPLWPWSLHAPFTEFSLHGGYQSLAWFHYVTMAMDAGYYGLGLVDIHQKGPFGGGANHWIMICGARTRREPLVGIPGNRIINEVLVSCSSTRTPDEEWVEPGKFLTERGGFNLLLARPARASDTGF
jgi:hypothetical protein